MHTTDTTTPLRQLLDAGAPREHVGAEAHRHLAAIRALPLDTEGRDEAIRQVEALLEQISD